MARYRRRNPSRSDTLASIGASAVVAAGAAAVTFYVTRLLLSRDEHQTGRLPAPAGRALPAPDTSEPPGGEGR